MALCILSFLHFFIYPYSQLNPANNSLTGRIPEEFAVNKTEGENEPGKCTGLMCCLRLSQFQNINLTNLFPKLNLLEHAKKLNAHPIGRLESLEVLTLCKSATYPM